MGWFELDPRSMSQRVSASEKPVHVPTLSESILRGGVGFTLVSIAGFTPWVLAGKWFYRNPGELVMYSTCALMFMGLSGLLLHRLIIGPGSLRRFYAFFSAAFLIYSIGWTSGWMVFRGHLGSAVGLLIGTMLMSIVFGFAFDARHQIAKVAAVLFATNALGYFVGGWIENYLSHQSHFGAAGIMLSGAALAIFMKYMWAICYGVGFGAGLGFAFYSCQTAVRAILKPS
jgi:hypothetical protein